MDKVNIRSELARISEYWSQVVIGEGNNQLFKIAKGLGSTNWHKHDDQDEIFILYKGCMIIELRDRTIQLFEDDMFIVPKGVEHRPKADNEAEFLIIGLNITSTEAGGKPNL
jgi:mannose-6-phosphate isomerase-like protein (cupin superfamily)